MASNSSLEDRVAVVTGASRGIGRASALRLAADGARVVLAARDGAGLEETAAACGPGTVVHPCDLSRPDEVEALFRAAHSQCGRLDILVAAAGRLTEGQLGVMRPEEVQALFDLNILGAFQALQWAARLMRRGRSGSVILVGSIVGERGAAGQVAYAASKAALSGMTRAAARELGPSGVRVNAVAPGFIDTALTAGLAEEVKIRALAAIPLGRAGTPQEVADVVAFLASDAARYVSGQVLGVDGAMSL